MSAIKIDIEQKVFMVEVKVDEKYAYSTHEIPEVIKSNLEKLFELLVIENIEIKVK